MTWWLIFPAVLLIVSARYGNLSMDPLLFGMGKTKKQIAIGIVGMYVSVVSAILITIGT